MTFGQLIDAFVHADTTFWILLAISLDVILGSVAALKLGTFRLSYFADFLRNDVAFKMIPFFVIWTGAHVAGGRDVIGGFVDLNDIENAMFVALMAAWGASIAGSIYQLGVIPGGPTNLKTALFGGENSAPPKD